ncbi:MAG: phosphoglycolate phosphatase [Ramlibacter sp.]|uniref:phosphoglycolate phosphatase n=1 Tax=Ramlibacter sp. TaxID=1917967 RepID=UPI00262C7EBC|nr:phosphoglycolate phosphatase [Ramlibacter sp.]MDH4376746.1 phosphoglycolate phosphatase [Ramlibacter sp.]
MNALELQAVIIDLDGTLVDTLGDFEVALNRALGDLQVPPASRSLIERSIGKGSEHLIRTVLAHQLADQAAQGAHADTVREVEALFSPVWARYEHHYLDINGGFSQVFPGVMDGLAQLQAMGLPLACLTNKPIAFARPLMAAKGLSPYFAQVFGGDSFERKKPDPLPLLKTCEALQTAPERTLMVGDSSNDAQAANAAGCPVVLMTYGYNHGEPIRNTPALAWLDSLAQLQDVVAR